MFAHLHTPLQYLKGIGPQKALLLEQELNLYTIYDLIQHYPFRYEDRTRIYTIKEIQEEDTFVQFIGTIEDITLTGNGKHKRLVATCQDTTGELELIWFQGIAWIEKKLLKGPSYLIAGKPNFFGKKITLPHPELELIGQQHQVKKYIQPIYSTTEKLKRKYIDSKALSKWIQHALQSIENDLIDNLPVFLLEKYQFLSKKESIKTIHFPKTISELEQAKRRLKFEELFYNQFKFFLQKKIAQKKFKGHIFHSAPSVTEFYTKHLSFELTDAQKRVIKEIYHDLTSGRQMNRLLQGDVGSGKTIVAFITMLMAYDNHTQACLMAPTELLAQQHAQTLVAYCESLHISIALLTGSTKQAERKKIIQQLQTGELHFIVGTHALLEDPIQFKNLGLCIIDEQHRFGVAQRAQLWNKNNMFHPHILVMTATPIPRTLAMTLYGDLDLSMIDELPSGRKPIITLHRNDAYRLKVFGFLKDQIEKGRQVYIIYPLIEESDHFDLKDLMDGYESIARAFPDYPLSIVHGRMRAEDKEYEMKRFLKKETKIMVATTVIEVGINIPNATVMVIENAEKFGLSQLHQLRGRVGRGSEQSYCILMTKPQLSAEARTRIETMVKTTNGFEIAEVDLQLRGAGDLAGTQQSGLTSFHIADLLHDQELLLTAREEASIIVEKDPTCALPEHEPIKLYLHAVEKDMLTWIHIS